jgi:hypothetical protein
VRRGGRTAGRGIALVVAAAEESPEHEPPVPELRPWREVGWIFTDGDPVAVERRRGERLPLRPPPSAQRDD